MAGRYYLAPIVGTGSNADPFRAKTADILSDWAAIIPSKADGSPKFAFCLVHAPDDTRLTSDPDHDAFPLVALSTLWVSLSLTVRTTILSKINTKFGLSLVPAAGDTLGDVLRALGRALEPTFSGALKGV